MKQREAEQLSEYSGESQDCFSELGVVIKSMIVFAGLGQRS
jgi:hypothetical protein